MNTPAEKEIGTGLHCPTLLHVQHCFRHLGYKKGNFPVTEHLDYRCLLLPMFAELSDEQTKYVAHSIRAFFK